MSSDVAMKTSDFVYDIMNEEMNMIASCILCMHTVEIRNMAIGGIPICRTYEQEVNRCVISYTICSTCKNRYESKSDSVIREMNMIVKRAECDNLEKIARELSYSSIHLCTPVLTNVDIIRARLRSTSMMNYVETHMPGSTIETAERMPYMRPGFF